MEIKIIGGGLAGVEAAYQLIKRGYSVKLYEMRPNVSTPAHTTENLAELVCSNSLKSIDISTPQGALKREMSAFSSIVMEASAYAKVPGGGALVVDRELFSKKIEEILSSYKNFTLIREECTTIDDYTIVASGPLSSKGIEESIKKLTNESYLHFYDAVAPIIKKSSIDLESAFFAARYNKGDDDYINCPMNKEEYLNFYQNLRDAAVVILKAFEKGDFFEACMPIEAMAKRQEDTMRFGPLKPVGIYNPKTNLRPYAVVQLRKEDNYDNLYNIVGFQTNLKFSEQERVFRLIPALKDAEFVRYGVMHRNTYINSPKVLTKYLNLKDNDKIFFAGQVTGVEGYMESAMSGIIAGINMARCIECKPLLELPKDTMIGSLLNYISTDNSNFSPMHVNFGILSELDDKIKDKKERKTAYSERAYSEIIKHIRSL